MLAPADNSAPYIRIEQVSRRFVQGLRSQGVLTDVNFTLRKGETVALLGRSGSGKTTLLNLLSGIDTPDSGKVLIGNCDLAALTQQQATLFRRQHIGFVYQFFNLVPSLSAQENIALVLELNGVATQVALQQAREFLDSMGLGDKAEQFPTMLSGGEQQRVAIARALIHQPALVLADEPTGNLDAKTGELVMQWLREQLSRAGSTMLLVTHSLAVARSADRILTLEDGVIAERDGDFAW